MEERFADVAPVERRSQQQVVDLMAARTVLPRRNLALTVVNVPARNFQEPARPPRQYRVPIGRNLDADSPSRRHFPNVIYSTPPWHAAALAGAGVELVERFCVRTRKHMSAWGVPIFLHLEGRDIPDPPPSLAMLLNRAQPGATRAGQHARCEVRRTGVPARRVGVTGTRPIQGRGQE